MNDFPRLNDRISLEAKIEQEKKYPECTKLSRIRNDKAILLCFLEWLEEKELVIAKMNDDAEYCPVGKAQDKLLMEYFGIDTAKLEKERRKILNEQRKLNEGKP